MLMAILQQFIKALFVITPTQQIVCSIVSRQLIAHLSPTNRQRVADQLQTISNQLAINRPPVADRLPTGRRYLGIVVADQSPIDLQPKNAVFDRTVVALFAAGFWSQGSRRQVAVHVWPGLVEEFIVLCCAQSYISYFFSTIYICHANPTLY